MLRKPKGHENAPVSSMDKSAEIAEEKKALQAREKRQTMANKMMLPLSILLVLAMLTPLVYVIVTRLGLGAPFPLQRDFIDSEPVLPANSLEIVAELPMPPGNLAVSSSGRVFFNFHPEYAPDMIKIAELDPKRGSYAAFPSSEFQSRIISCLSMRVDRQDRLWLLDFANHGIKGAPTLYAFALKEKDALVHEYVFPASVAGFGSMLNDFQVDPSGQFVYLVDTSIVSSTPALIVYSIRDRYGFRILSSHSSMFGRSSFLDVSGTLLKYGPMGLTINADSIALDRTGSKLYYGALTGDKMFAVSTSHLLHYLRAANESHSDQLILDEIMPSHVTEVLKDKPATDGITTDGAGNIWMTALEHSAIAVAIPLKAAAASVQQDASTFALQYGQFKVVKVVQDPALLRWPDGFSFGPDGLYITNSALHLKFSGKDYKNYAPFHILRLPTKALHSVFEHEKDSTFVLPAAGH